LLVWIFERIAPHKVILTFCTGFLRALEFYDGILFLTTNRIGAFDEAFISRIHVQLHYPDFDDEGRQRIWQTFMDKLERERSSTMRIHISALEYIGGEKIKELKLNGREIRNGTLPSPSTITKHCSM
jgi:hypothetical protein